jgi:hypothetical protein
MPEPLEQQGGTWKHGGQLTQAADEWAEASSSSHKAAPLSLSCFEGPVALRPRLTTGLPKVRDECDISKRQIKHENIEIRHAVARMLRSTSILSNAGNTRRSST